MFAVKRVTKGFNSKTTCDARTYSYTLPTYMFTKEGEEFQDTSFRLSSERFEELNKTLALYVGTKNFHNYTIKKLPNDPSVFKFEIVSLDAILNNNFLLRSNDTSCLSNANNLSSLTTLKLNLQDCASLVSPLCCTRLDEWWGW